MIFPEIYQIELTNVCNFNCSYCQRQFPEGTRPEGFMELSLIEKMGKYGDFDGSSFTELQMNGEPTIHPEFGLIVHLMKKYVPFIGMSTNATMIDKWFNAILQMDCLTVSIHPETNLKQLNKDLKGLVKKFKGKIRIQALSNANIEQVQFFEKWKADERVVTEVFPIQDYLDKKIYNTRGCINPWYSVSVQWDGDVVPCCKAVGKEYVYGNLTKQTLREIWGNKKVKKMRDYQLGRVKKIGLCEGCDFKSPHKFHIDILEKSL